MRRPKSISVVLFQDHSPVVHIRSIEAGPAPAPNVLLSFVDDTDWAGVVQLFQACVDVVQQHMVSDHPQGYPLDDWDFPQHELDDNIPF